MPPSDAKKSKLLSLSIKKLLILKDANGRVNKFEYFFEYLALIKDLSLIATKRLASTG